MKRASWKKNARRGESGKGVLLGLGIGCVVVILLCGGVLAVGGFFLYRTAEEFAEMAMAASSDDPAEIRSRTAEITEITIPDKFEPEYSFKMDFQTALPIADADGAVVTPRFVVYSLDEDDGVLMLASVDNLDYSAEEMMMQARASLFDPDEWEDFEITEEETREIVVRDEPASFDFAKGKHRSREDEYWRVFGTFEGASGPAAILIFMRAEEGAEDEIREIIDSIQ